MTEPKRLAPYGIAGLMVPVGGHTPGWSVLLLDDDDAVVGDSPDRIEASDTRPAICMHPPAWTQPAGFGGEREKDTA